MADEVTPGELDRRLRDHEVRTDRVHAEQDNRIARVAAESLPLDVYQADQRARDRENTIRDRRLDAVEARPQMTFTNKLALYGVLVAFLGVVVAAWAATKGA